MNNQSSEHIEPLVERAVSQWERVISTATAKATTNQLHTQAIEYLELADDLQYYSGPLIWFKDAWEKYGIDNITYLIEQAMAFKKDSGLSDHEFDYMIKEGFFRKEEFIKNSSPIKSLVKRIPGVDKVFEAYLIFKAFYYGLKELLTNASPATELLGIGALDFLDPLILSKVFKQTSDDPLKVQQVVNLSKSGRIVWSEITTASFTAFEICIDALTYFGGPFGLVLGFLSGFSMDIFDQRTRDFKSKPYLALDEWIVEHAKWKIDTLVGRSDESAEQDDESPLKWIPFESNEAPEEAARDLSRALKWKPFTRSPI